MNPLTLKKIYISLDIHAHNLLFVTIRALARFNT